MKDNYNWLSVTLGCIGRSGNSGAAMGTEKLGDQLVYWGGADRGDG